MLERFDTPENTIRTIHLTLTRHCNMNCVYCFSESDISRAQDELTTRDWVEIIDQVTEEYGPVSIIVKGGEPMLREDFFEILDHIKSRGHFVTLVTNGILIQDQETAAKLDRCVDQMEVSLDGISPATTDPIKGPGMFDRIMTGVDQIRKTHIKLGLSFVILEQNQAILWDSLESFIKQQGEEAIAVRIDNRVSFPVDLRDGKGDFFDFLRNTDKLACHGRLGRNPASAELEVDASGMLHPYCPVSPDRPQAQPM